MVTCFSGLKENHDLGTGRTKERVQIRRIEPHGGRCSSPELALAEIPI
jgi:hypothetical protein